MCIRDRANIKAIKELVKEDRGITFIYERAVKKELENKELVKIGLKSFKAKREFYRCVFS